MVRVRVYLVLLVLSRVREAGDDCGDPAGRRDLAGVDHDEQLHERVVHLSTPRLDDVDVLPTHALAYLHSAPTPTQHTSWIQYAQVSTRQYSQVGGAHMRIADAVNRG